MVAVVIYMQYRSRE